jgi:chemotaxis-related protein WspD
MARLLARPLSPDDLAEQSERVGRPQVETRTSGEGFLLFQSAEEQLALPARSVTCVTRAAKIHRVPHRTNDVLRGLCSIDGELMLCASLENLLDLSKRPTTAPGSEQDADNARNDRTIVIGDDRNRWAFVADAVLGVARVAPEDHHPVPMTVERAMIHYTKSLLSVGDTQVSLLDPERLLSGFKAALP